MWMLGAPQVAAVPPPPAAGDIVRASVQFCPPKLSAKIAVPLMLGVPVIVYTTLPAPVANVPPASVAVKPVTPVELTI